jgi:radical SAM protein with 4Fe4S-binding SPASM domain
VTIATNGTLLTQKMAQTFKKMGVANIAIGLNANDKKLHEQITHVAGSFEKSKRAIYLTAESGMNLQINTTVMKENKESIPDLLNFASEVNAQIVLLYQMIPAGRGEEEMELSVKEYKSFTDMVARFQKNNRAIIEPTCSPQFWAHLLTRNGNKPSKLSMRLAEMLFKGCVAGNGLCYIKPDGEVWACPFIPISGGNIHDKSLREIWYKSEIFKNLKDREKITGVKCSKCDYKYICGGCRGRAYAHSGNYLEDDPFCFIEHGR